MSTTERKTAERVQFQREDRYIVIKRSDFESMRTSSKEKEELGHILYAINSHRTVVLGKQPLRCLVVESDWPEYEPTWEAIQRRMEGKPLAPSREAELQTQVDDLRQVCQEQSDRLYLYSKDNEHRIVNELQEALTAAQSRIAEVEEALERYKEALGCYDHAIDSINEHLKYATENNLGNCLSAIKLAQNDVDECLKETAVILQPPPATQEVTIRWWLCLSCGYTSRDEFAQGCCEHSDPQKVERTRLVPVPRKVWREVTFNDVTWDEGSAEGRVALPRGGTGQWRDLVGRTGTTVTVRWPEEVPS